MLLEQVQIAINAVLITALVLPDVGEGGTEEGGDDPCFAFPLGLLSLANRTRVAPASLKQVNHRFESANAHTWGSFSILSAMHRAALCLCLLAAVCAAQGTCPRTTHCTVSPMLVLCCWSLGPSLFVRWLGF